MLKSLANWGIDALKLIKTGGDGTVVI